MTEGTAVDQRLLVRVARQVIPIVFFVVSWQAISMSGWIPPALFPPPDRVFRAGIEMTRSGELLHHLRASASRLTWGLFAGGFLGVAVGLLTGRLRLFRDTLSPLIQLFRPLPPVAIIPLVIVWFGIGEFAKVFSIAFAVFFPVWIGTHSGARQIPQRFLWSASTLTRSRVKLIRHVILPASLPFVVAGLRVGIAVAFVMVFVAELAGASEGIGYVISVSSLAYRIDRMMVGLVVLGAFGALVDLAFDRAMNKLCPWLKLAQAK